MPRPRQSSVTSRRGRDPSPSLPTVATLPLGCSVAAFTAAWERSHAVVLKRPRRTTRGSAALVPASGAFEAVRELLRDDPEIGATFTSECGSAPDSKRRRRLGLQVGSDQTRGAVLGRAAPPGGSWYCSWISAREDLLQAVPLSRPPCLPASAAQEAAVWWFVGRNGSSNEALPGRPEHTDEVSHDGTWHYQLEGSKEWRLRPTTELCERLRGGGRGGGGGGGGGSAMRFEDMMRDESVGAPAAAAPAWEADFSSFSAPVEAAGSGWADFDAVGGRVGRRVVAAARCGCCGRDGAAGHGRPVGWL